MLPRGWWIAVLLAGAGEALAAADAGLRLGADWWDYEVSGTVDDDGMRVDFERDLSVETRSNHRFELGWDSGPGPWPDLVASWLPIDAGGQRTTTSGGTPGPLPLPTPGTTTLILADAEIDDIDLVLRYPVALGAARAWGGVAVKHLRGDLASRAANASEVSRQEVDEWFPMLHVALAWPAERALRLAARADAIAADGDRALDWRIGAEWALGRTVVVGAGWARREYRLEADDFRLDTTLDGARLGLEARF